MPREIVVDWTTSAGGGFVSVFFFNEAVDVVDQRDRLALFLTPMRNNLSAGTTFTIRTTGRELDDATGTLTGVWNDPRVLTNVGAGTGQPVADTTQILCRWGTNTIVNGRFLKGRTFIPGMVAGSLQNGNISPTALGNMNAAVAFLIDPTDGFGVWHRPVLGAGGVFQLAISSSVWSELAVLRRRRK